MIAKRRAEAVKGVCKAVHLTATIFALMRASRMLWRNLAAAVGFVEFAPQTLRVSPILFHAFRRPIRRRALGNLVCVAHTCMRDLPAMDGNTSQPSFALMNHSWMRFMPPTLNTPTPPTAAKPQTISSFLGLITEITPSHPGSKQMDLYCLISPWE